MVNRLMNLTRAVKKTYIYLLAFLLPAGIMLTVYIVKGVYPFGPQTLLTIDMSNEYVDYFSMFKSLFTGGNSVFYSFEKLLGGNMTGLFAYYLASPFNLIFLFFNTENFDVAVMLITLLKIGCCGVTFAIYIDRTFEKPGLLTTVFSVCYALMAYNIIYQLNIMWLDGVICLPIVMLGIDRIIDRKQPLLYYVSLLAALLTNYYIGYMICIFSLLYFIYKVLLSKSYMEAYLKGRFFRGRLTLFLFTSVLSAGTGCFLLLPALLSLKTGKEQFSIGNFGFFSNFDIGGIFSKIVLGSQSYKDAINGMPGIFCGLFVVLLVCLYFLNRRITMREKLYSAAFLLILLVNFYLNTFNIIWHGFNPPTWFPFRYSFVFSFLLIVLAYRSVISMKSIRLRHVLFTCIVVLVVLIRIYRKRRSRFRRFLWRPTAAFLFTASERGSWQAG